MARLRSSSAPRGATCTSRDLRRLKRGRREDWVRPFRGLLRALDASAKLIDSTLRTVAVSERCAHKRPIRTSRNLNAASDKLLTASVRLERAAARLSEMHACMMRHPEDAECAPEVLSLATTRFIGIATRLTGVADQVFGLHQDVLHGLKTGELVPEASAFPRPRIVLVPRPAPVRAFLRDRLPRVVDRISALLRRRRRTRLPASLRVPRRTSQGRAPPLVPVCLL
jgi:hypothetical protein